MTNVFPTPEGPNKSIFDFSKRQRSSFSEIDWIEDVMLDCIKLLLVFAPVGIIWDGETKLK